MTYDDRARRLRTAALFVFIVLLAVLAVIIGPRIHAADDDLVVLPDGVTRLFQSPSIPFRIYVQCDTQRHTLVYASATAIVVVPGGC